LIINPLRLSYYYLCSLGRSQSGPLNLLPACFVYKNGNNFPASEIARTNSVEKRLMKSKIRNRVFGSMAQVAILAALAVAVLTGALTVRAQTPSNFRGTITAIAGTTLTVKPDTGDPRQVDVPSTAAILRIAPGQTNLSAAVPIQFSELANGDRVLVKLDPDASGPTAQALRVIAIKQEDVAAKQQKDREDWQLRGVGGLVKSVDTASGVVVLTSGAGATAKTITVHIAQGTAKATIVKRYAPASVSYDAAVAAPINAIKAGDQLRARGEKNADGTSIDAEEVISGTFRNLSGTVISTDVTASTLVVKDLVTKKQVTVHITSDVQMRRLPDMMARILAARLKGGAGAAGSGSAGGYGGGAGAGSGSGAGAGWNGNRQAAGGAPPAAGGAPPAAGGGPAGGNGQWAGAGRGGPGGGDPQQMLSRAPAIQLADLKKDDAVMVVATDGTTDVTAITLVAGVEPLLEAPAASQSLLNNWSMNSGAGAAEAAAQ
jgi:hypothetical protein